MKTFFLILLCTLCFNFKTSSQNLLTEDFLFGPIDSIDNSNEWYRSGVNFGDNIRVVAPGLDYSGYIGSGRGNTSQLINSGEGDVAYKNLSAPVTAGSAYMSIMLRVDSLPLTVTEGYIIAFNPNTGGTNLNTALHIKRLTNNSFDLGVRKASQVAYANRTYDLGKTYLVVLKYSIINGTANDSSKMYVFTTGVPSVEPNLSTSGTVEGSDYTGQESVHLVNNYAQSGLNGIDVKIDGIRVGTSWETSVLAEITSINSVNSEKALSMFASPNPFNQSTNIYYELPESANVRIIITNQSGQKCTEFEEKQAKGKQEFRWDAANFPAGTYLVSILFNGKLGNYQLIRL